MPAPRSIAIEDLAGMPKRDDILRVFWLLRDLKKDVEGWGEIDFENWVISRNTRGARSGNLTYAELVKVTSDLHDDLRMGFDFRPMHEAEKQRLSVVEVGCSVELRQPKSTDVSIGLSLFNYGAGQLDGMDAQVALEDLGCLRRAFDRFSFHCSDMQYVTEDDMEDLAKANVILNHLSVLAMELATETMKR